MASSTTPRRTRIEKGIYISQRASGLVYEIGFYDDDGSQRWRVVDGGLDEARNLRKKLHANRGRDNRLRADIMRVNKMAKTFTPSKNAFREVLAATKGPHPRQAWLMLSALALAKARSLDRGDG